MAVAANTNKTYDVTTIREDLSEAMASLTPTDTIFMSTIGSRNVDNTYYEWSEVDLAAVIHQTDNWKVMHLETVRQPMPFVKGDIPR